MIIILVKFLTDTNYGTPTPEAESGVLVNSAVSFLLFIGSHYNWTDLMT